MKTCAGIPVQGQQGGWFGTYHLGLKRDNIDYYNHYLSPSDKNSRCNGLSTLFPAMLGTFNARIQQDAKTFIDRLVKPENIRLNFVTVFGGVEKRRSL
jgi:hypothetical protein